MPISDLRWRMSIAEAAVLLVSYVLRPGPAAGDGYLDPRFAGGVVISDSSGQSDYASSVALQPDDRVVVAGWSGTDSFHSTLARYDANGELDRSFGEAGKVRTKLGAFSSQLYSSAADGDGVVVTGYTIGATADVVVARHLTNPCPQLRTR